MKKGIISVRSTLRKKQRKKWKKGSNNTIMNAREDMLRSERTGKLKVAMIIIPIIIILIIIVVLFFGVREFLKISSLYAHDESQSNSQTEVVIDPTDDDDSKKIMTIVSPNNELNSDYKLNLASYNEIKIDILALDALTHLMEDSEKEFLSLNITSGYISSDEQNELYNKEVQRLISEENYSKARAETEAEKNVPKGGFSDQQTGLSVTFSSNTNKNFENSKEYKWLIKNAMKYGFVLRYPESKEFETDMNYNPSLFRYVGVENATKMRTLNMCLDEYSSYLNSRDYY